MCSASVRTALLPSGDLIMPFLFSYSTLSIAVKGLKNRYKWHLRLLLEAKMSLAKAEWKVLKRRKIRIISHASISKSSRRKPFSLPHPAWDGNRGPSSAPLSWRLMLPPPFITQWSHFLKTLNVTLETRHQFGLDGCFIKTSELLCPKYTHTHCTSIIVRTLMDLIDWSANYQNHPQLNLNLGVLTLKQSFEMVFVVFLFLSTGPGVIYCVTVERGLCAHLIICKF